MRLIILGLLALTFIGCSRAEAPAVKLDNDEQKTLYAIGVALSQSLAPFGLSEAELAYVKAGLADGVTKREPKVDMQTYGPKIQQLAQARAATLADGEKKAGAEYLAKAAAEKGAKKTASGVIVQTLTPGNGASPTANEVVKVHYEGKLVDGTVFDSSIKRGQPATFPLGNVIKCWIEGVQQMKVGGKARLVCPPDTAYGDRGSPPVIKPGATLVFEVELLEIVK